MDAANKILKHIAAEDALWTSRLRGDKFENDRSRNQAVGRVKQLDEFRDFVSKLTSAGPEEDGLEEIDVTGSGAQEDPGEAPAKPRTFVKPRRW